MRGIRAAVLAVGVAGACLGLARGARADWDSRAGWFAGAGLGGGSGRVSAPAASHDREIGGAANLRAQFAVTPRIGVGVGLSMWFSDIDGTRYTVTAAGPTGTWYPAGSDVFLRGTFGVGSVSSGGGSTDRSRYGFAATAAVGYEFHVVPSVTAGPQLEYGYVNVGDHTSAEFANATVGFNWLLPGR